MTGKNPHPRRRLLVNRPYQIRFVAEVLAVVILTTCASTATAYFLTSREVESGFFSGHRKLVSLQQILPKVLVASALVTLVAMALLGAYITLRETHRVMGPARKMERKFLEMAEGDFSYMSGFRKGDVLKGLDDYINIHLNNLGDFFTSFDRTLEETGVRLEALERSPEDRAEQISQIRELLAGIDHYADAFRPR